jgi:hypothetical protein
MPSKDLYSDHRHEPDGWVNPNLLFKDGVSNNPEAEKRNLLLKARRECEALGPEFFARPR